jgi:hypothetical protein
MIWWSVLACQGPIEPLEHRGGVALGLFADDATYDYSALVDEIAAAGATDLLVAVPWRLPNLSSHALQQATPRTALAKTLRQAEQHGLVTTVMPLVTLDDRGNGAWRGRIDPHDRPAFWDNYRALLRAVAVDAERGGSGRLIIGSELNALESDSVWPALASEVRGVFSGKVTYSANWDRYGEVPFWTVVDEVAVTAYFPVVAADTWSTELASLHRFAADNGRPLVVSEYGYPALATARSRPWDETTGGAYAPDLQATLVADALHALQCQPPAAHFLWNWFGTGDANEASFTPRNRPAAPSVSSAFSRSSCPESVP